MSNGRRALSVTFAVVSLLVEACGSATVTPPASQGQVPVVDPASPGSALVSASPLPSGSGPTGMGGPLDEPPGISEGDLVPDPSPSLPEPILTDPNEIADGLYAPDGVGLAVVSLLDQMGIAILARDGTVLRPASGRPAADLTLTEDEVRGLIAMGVQDAAAIVPGLPGGSPFTFRDLYRALAPVLPNLTSDDLAASYARAYDEHPETTLGAIFGPLAISSDRALTRVHLWLLYVDGFVHGRTAALGDPARTVAVASGTGWGVTDPFLPDLSSPDPRLSGIGFALMLAHLPVLGFSIPFTAQPIAVSGHEGHGGLGQAVPLNASVGVPGPVGLIDPVTGTPLFPSTGHPPDGIPVRWDTNDQAVLDAHGSLDGALHVPVSTDQLGATSLRYVPKKEKANGRGDEVAAIANLQATVGLRDLVTRFFDISPFALGFLLGDRTTPAMLHIGWHEEAGLELDLTNWHAVKVEPLIQAFLPAFDGIAQRVGVDTTHGFLARQADGTYRGTLPATINLSTVHMAFGSTRCDFGGGSGIVASSGQWLTVIGHPSTTTGWSGYDPNLWRPIMSGSADSEVVQLSFYPAGPAKAWPVWCLSPVEYDDPQRGPQGMYAPFNDLAWTNPTIGYAIFTPSTGSLRYLDVRGTRDPFTTFARGPLIDGSVWSVTVTRKGAAP